MISLPDFISTEIHTPTSDFLLLCCDGLFERLTNEQVIDFVQKQLDKDPSLDPAVVLSRLLDHSLTAGSKDNMTAVLVQFQDGTNYNRERDEFIPGPFKREWSMEFISAYTQNAARYGYSLEEALALQQQQQQQQQPQQQQQTTEIEIEMQQSMSYTQSAHLYALHTT